MGYLFVAYRDTMVLRIPQTATNLVSPPPASAPLSKLTSHLHSAPFFAVRQQFWQNLLKRGENEVYTDHCRHSNQLFLEDFSVNHNFLQARRPMAAPLG